MILAITNRQSSLIGSGLCPFYVKVLSNELQREPSKAGIPLSEHQPSKGSHCCQCLLWRPSCAQQLFTRCPQGVVARAMSFPPSFIISSRTSTRAPGSGVTSYLLSSDFSPSPRCTVMRNSQPTSLTRVPFKLALKKKKKNLDLGARKY